MKKCQYSISDYSYAEKETCERFSAQPFHQGAKLEPESKSDLEPEPNP